MEKRSGLSELSIILWVSAIEGCPIISVECIVCSISCNFHQDARWSLALHYLSVPAEDKIVILCDVTPTVWDYCERGSMHSCMIRCSVFFV